MAGPFRDFLLWLHCPHETVRCLHGDEIIHRGQRLDGETRRRACVRCDRVLPGGLPLVCSVTGLEH